jgi:DNA invertase Pin-like site-specific DNA recombinase
VKKVAIYARVSLADGSQDVNNQLSELRAFCEQSRWEVTQEYVDRASDKTSANRAQFLKMFGDASQRKFDLVLFWALDRFTREGTLATLDYLQRLTNYGVDWRSYQEPYFDSCGPFVDVVISVSATLARMERQRLVERTVAGMKRARKEGKHIGRPKANINVHYLRNLQAGGMSIRKIAKKAKLSPTTIQRYLAAT